MSKKSPRNPGRANRLAISGWPLRFKVALAIAIPLLLAVTLGGLAVRSDLDEASNSSASSKQVTILPPTVAYLDAAERAMVAAQDTSGDSNPELDKAIEDIQNAAGQLDQARDSANLTADQRYQLDAMMDLSRAIREANRESLSADTWIAQLRQLQSGVTQLITSIVNAQINPEPRLEQLSQTIDGRFSLAMQQALAATDRAGATGSQELFSELGVEGASIDRLAGGLGSEDAKQVAALRTGNAERSHTIRTGGSDLGGEDAYKPYDDITDGLITGIDDQLASSASDARRSALISGAILLGALLGTILLAVLVSRLLLNPIRKVREGARNVAQEELPEAVARIRSGEDPGPIRPIDVTTQEEIGQLARAVDDLHEQAVTLASGEARLKAQVSEMFITLSRRNTSLINQQLGFIETLEKDEEDPQRLESLFRLDHLAARMRRTADSLLVLAEAPTHSTADDDLTVVTALHAATAGVQDYRRTRVGSASTAHILNSASADVVHLLTELVDNALAYSPPTSIVQLRSTPSEGGVRVEIEDAGLGIPERELVVINQNLHTGGDVTPETARRMGLFVVSRLADRHGIIVTLERNVHNGGTTAVVLLPSAILDVTRPAPAPTDEPAAVAAPQPSVSAPGGEPSLEDRLNAVTGLPRRQPGAQTPETGVPVPPMVPTQATDEPTTEPSPPPPSAPSVPPAAAAAVGGGILGRTLAKANVPEPEPEPEPGPAAEPEAAQQASEPTPASDAEPVPSAEAAPSAEAPPVVGPVPNGLPAPLPQRTRGEAPQAQPLAPIGQHATPEPDVAERQHGQHEQPAAAEPTPDVGGPIPARAFDPGPSGSSPSPLAFAEAGGDTPIFKALRSAWLSSHAGDESWRSSEVEAGWERADHVAEAVAEAPVNEAGLPVRRPGSQLVPGGVVKPAAPGSRDPDAIRARLSAHAAGVSRGRAAAAATLPDQEPTEDNPG
jgi:signal transduction histidine kinase